MKMFHVKHFCQYHTFITLQIKFMKNLDYVSRETLHFNYTLKNNTTTTNYIKNT